MTAEELIGRMDYSLLHPEVSVNDLVEACDATKVFKFGSLCVSPWLVEQAELKLRGTGLKVGSVVGFPLGTSTLGTKSFEAEEAIRNGATLLDIVLPIGHIKSRDADAVGEELTSLRAWVDRFAVTPIQLRGIIEAGLLTDKEKEQATLAVMEAGWDCVKTSSGFGPSGADAADVSMLAKLVGGRIKVKAAGGIRTADDVIAMVQAGADLVGTGNAPAIAAELMERQESGRLQD